MRVIVSDSSPIRYLVLIGEVDILQKLYGRILIPEAVRSELQQAATPEVVNSWISSAPDWLEVIPSSPGAAPAVSSALGEGERQAIVLALDVGADLMLMDDKAGAREARRLGLSVTGTLGILVRAGESGIGDLHSALRRLENTNFPVNPKLLRELEN